MSQEIELTEQQLEKILSALLEGATLGDVTNVSQDALEAGYGLAYSLYNAGNYADAETVFNGLCMYDHTDYRFWMGLGGARQARNKLESAIDAYAVATHAACLGSPVPVVYAAQCHIKLGNTEEAIGLFKAALEMGTTDNGEHLTCHKKAQAMLELLAQGA